MHVGVWRALSFTPEKVSACVLRLLCDVEESTVGEDDQEILFQKQTPKQS